MPHSDTERRGASVTVAIVSRGRPDLLPRAIEGCRQLYHPRFELVVVADPDGLDAVRRLPTAGSIKSVAFDRPNISAARNLALKVSAGDVVAFLDDDAVPEPTWLDRLIRAFDDPAVAAATGPVRGRNGISYQSLAPRIDRLGQSHDGRQAPPDAVVKLVGTNMAVRRSPVLELGGFDERFCFYLEDADLSLRLIDGGFRISHVEGAEVHHAFAASERRRADRVPRDLSVIGRSAGMFIASHTPPDLRGRAIDLVRASERRRILRHMVAGLCEPRDVKRLLGQLRDALEDGLTVASPRRVGASRAASFNEFDRGTVSNRHVALAARPGTSVHALDVARREVGDGAVVSLFVFGRTTLFHHVRFEGHGVWLQTGGQFGKSIRSAPLVQLTDFRKRAERELSRVQNYRCTQLNKVSSQIRWI